MTQLGRVLCQVCQLFCVNDQVLFFLLGWVRLAQPSRACCSWFPITESGCPIPSAPLKAGSCAAGEEVKIPTLTSQHRSRDGIELFPRR